MSVEKILIEELKREVSKLKQHISAIYMLLTITGVAIGLLWGR